MFSHQPLRRQLALLITFVLTLSVGLLCWAGYRQLEQALASATRVRLEDVAQQLARMISDAPTRALADAEILARRPEIVQVASVPEARELADSLLSSLMTLVQTRQPQSLGMTVLAPTGETIAAIGETPPGNVLTSREIIGPLAVSPEGPMYAVRAPIFDERNQPAGTLVYVRRMITAPSVSQRLAALIGSDAHLLIGNTDSQEWMDLNNFEVVPPLRQPYFEMAQLTAPSGQRVFSFVQPASGTPWSVGVFFPRAAALAPARTYVRNIVLAAIIVVTLGAATSATLVRDVTRSIEAATNAAEGIAQGDYSRRVPVTSQDEVARLARSFNTMASQVQTSRHELEEQSAALQQVNTELARNELRYRQFVEASPDAMIVHRGGRVLFANPAAATLLRAESPGALTGRSIQDLAAPAPEEPSVDMRTTGEYDAIRLPRTERELQREDGGAVMVEESTTPFIIDGKPATLTILRDITDRKRLEARVRSAQKMEVIGQLASGIAHDFNNLLTVISSYGSLLQADLPEKDPRRADVEEILNASNRAAGLTRQLLTLGRQQVVQMQLLDLHDVLAGLERMLKRVIPANITIRVLPVAQNAVVDADPSQLEQVFMNLAVNAVDAMPDGGTLTIETARVTVSPSEVPLYGVPSEGDYVSVAVRDTGHGIPQETMSRVFEPFFTTKSPGKGTGLGLATVAEIMRAMAGHIAVYSDVGRGTVFRLYIPAQEAVDMATTPHREWPITSHSGKAVLLVEDETPVRTVVRRILERAGFVVHDAENGREGIEIAAGLDNQLDVVVTDMTMPDIDGRELARRIAERNAKTVFVFMSGYTETATFWDEVPRERSVFLQKPFPEGDLTRAVSTALERAG